MNRGIETVPIEVIELCLKWMGRSSTGLITASFERQSTATGHAAAYQFAISDLSGAANQFLSPSDVKSPSMGSQPYVKEIHLLHYSNQLTKSQIALHRSVPVIDIKSPRHTPTPPSALHHFLHTLGHRF